MPESSVTRGLDRVYKKAQKTAIDLDLKKEKIIIFSDHHRGVRDGADDFMRCEKNYNAALGFYYEMGYKLVILGDAEDLWECWPKDVVKSYAYSLSLESEFNKSGRYIRIYGNHDDFWQHPDAVKKYLSQVFNPLPIVSEGIVFNITGASNKNPGEIFLTHGHQGTISSDIAAPVAKLAVRYIWRNFQRITGIKLNTPAKNTDKLHEHDQAMYNWARAKGGNTYLITGHTHSPFFSTDLIKNTQDSLNKAVKVKNNKERAKLRAQLEYLTTIYQTFLNNNSQISLFYFNTGCCSFSDGDITGIEIADGRMSLVRWPDETGLPQWKILDQFAL